MIEQIYLSGWIATIVLFIRNDSLSHHDDIACSIVAALWPITVPIMIMLATFDDA